MLPARTIVGAIVGMGVLAAAASCGGGGNTGGSGGTSHTGTGGGGAGPATSSSSGSPSSSSGSTTTSSSSSGSASSSSGAPPVGGLFQAPEPWNTPVDGDSPDAKSKTIIDWLVSAGGWGNGNVFQIDFGLNIQYADASTPMMPFTLADGDCTPDCDDVTTFPVPAGGAVEGEDGYGCVSDGDCHLLVVDTANAKLYEMWRAFAPPDPSTFYGTGAFIWDLKKAYPPNLRGDGCTSADAGGFPMAAMLFTADEVAAGHIDHAIRFILPNGRIQDGPVYVHPATHTGVNVSPDTRPDAPPYGVRFRLKSTFDLSKLPSDGARVVARALQKYGMFLSDGGNIALTAADDRFTTAKWSDANVDIDAQSLSAMQVSDFEVVNMGPLITTGDTCVRNP